MNNGSLSILVTGTSNGFGRRIAKTMALRGHHVFASMRGVEGKNVEAATAMRDWASAEGLALEVIDLDITDQATIDAAIAHVLASAGRIDVVVNNAATGTAGLLEAFTIEDVRRSFDNVAFGALRVDKAVLPTMRKQGSGLLIHVSSTGGRIFVPFVSPYSAAKAALEGFAEELSYELAPFGIDSIIVEPGGFPTEGLTNGSNISGPSDQDVLAEYGALALKPQQMFEGFGEAFSGPGAPDPQEVADAIAELIDLPAGGRPLRTVVGSMITAGVRELNEAYDKSRTELLSSIDMA
jgi:NAD(P)-dependent dehydrogenase (short-subunit alcohol dehydrogenase family)